MYNMYSNLVEVSEYRSYPVRTSLQLFRIAYSALVAKNLLMDDRCRNSFSAFRCVENFRPVFSIEPRQSFFRQKLSPFAFKIFVTDLRSKIPFRIQQWSSIIN
jgi:hypothetical protein